MTAKPLPCHSFGELSIPTTMKHFITITLLLLVAFGCSPRTRITGTVKYGDGTPVAPGHIIFEDVKYSFVGDIDADGTYVTGAEKAKDGIPNGVYKVYLGGYNKPFVDFAAHKIQENITVDPKICSASTTDLVFEVKRNCPKTFDITVTRPAEKNQK
jgi:hypothetical protein